MPKSSRKRPLKRTPRAKKQGPKLSVRWTVEERAVIREIIRDAKKIRPYVSGSDVIRELMDLTYTGLVTPEMRKKLRDLIEHLGTGGKENQLPPIEGPSEYKHSNDDDEEDDVLPMLKRNAA